MKLFLKSFNAAGMHSCISSAIFQFHMFWRLFFYGWGGWVKPCNQFLDSYVKKHFNLLQWVGHLYHTNKWLPGGNTHLIPNAYELFSSRDINGAIGNNETQFQFTEKENTVGRKFLKKNRSK